VFLFYHPVYIVATAASLPFYHSQSILLLSTLCSEKALSNSPTINFKLLFITQYYCFHLYVVWMFSKVPCIVKIKQEVFRKSNATCSF